VEGFLSASECVYAYLVEPCLLAGAQLTQSTAITALVYHEAGLASSQGDLS
jgi:hypothetical protein